MKDVLIVLFIIPLVIVNWDIIPELLKDWFK